MLDRHRTAALPFAGSTLLAEHYHEVPLLSLAWGVGQIGLPFSESGAISIFGLSLPLEDDSTIVASVTPALSLAGALNLKVEEIAPTDQVASQPGRCAGHPRHLGPRIHRPSCRRTPPTTASAAAQNRRVTQKRNRVVVTATLTPSLIASLAQGNNAPPASNSNPDASK